LQVVQTTKTDTFTQSSTDTWSDVTGLSVSITPASASNKILVMGKVAVGGDNSVYGMTKLVRGSTDIFIGDSASNRTRATSGTYSHETFGGTAHYGMVDQSFTFLDSPATTSSTTYKIQLRAGNVTSAYINRGGYDANNNFATRTASSIIVMEISAW